jgi:hypothetical protein
MPKLLVKKPKKLKDMAHASINASKHIRGGGAGGKLLGCHIQQEIDIYTSKSEDHLSHLPIWHHYWFYPGPKLYQLTGFDIIFNSGSPVGCCSNPEK